MTTSSILPKDIEEFLKRINDLHIEIDDVEKAEVVGEKDSLTIPNIPGKQNSLKLYMYLSNKNSGMIDTVFAQKGLEIFGSALQNDAKENPGKHPAIDLLFAICSGTISKAKIVITRK